MWLMVKNNIKRRSSPAIITKAISTNGSTFPVMSVYFNLDYRLNLYAGYLCVNYIINQAAERRSFLLNLRIILLCMLKEVNYFREVLDEQV